MTTTVTVAAHCNDDEEVQVVITETGGEPIEQELLQDGETKDFSIWDDRKITVQEISNPTG